MISATLDTSVYIRALHLGGPAASLIGHAHDARGKLSALANHVAPTVSLTGSKEDPDDDRILECAATAKSDYIVSQDKDLLRLAQYENARIVIIVGLLAILAAQ